MSPPPTNSMLRLEPPFYRPEILAELILRPELAVVEWERDDVAEQTNLALRRSIETTKPSRS